MNIFNDKGLTIVESLIAVVLTVIAVVGLTTMQPLGLQSAGKADSLTHATEIMQSQLETIECSIMHGTIPASANVTETVGNETFTVNTTIAANATRWLVRVSVTGQGNTKPVRSSIIVSTQNNF
jgi:Tfp pilus assembly protein PilV